MAREGLRTLVVSKKTLTEEQYADFEQRFQAAKFSAVSRSAQVAAVVQMLNLHDLCEESILLPETAGYVLSKKIVGLDTYRYVGRGVTLETWVAETVQFDYLNLLLRF